jgi:hypothetical protein
MQSGHCGIPLSIKGGPCHGGEVETGYQRDKAEHQGSQGVELVEQAKLGEVETYKIYIF